VGTLKFFCDTYALVEFIKGNPAYFPYHDKELHTGIMNLYELFYTLLRDYGEEIAKDYFYHFSSLVIAFEEDHVFAASKFKLQHYKKEISYVDALGYTLASAAGMKFLTGDKEFENIERVEFVK